ncbi:hypothetical protein TWF694_005642 [Orbilia ellipsospora]|uniref:Uncharacterized protein n=1 Tax=Orbilia ellipsospora TaxID=2528407 RepID=A0AAV9WV10_9PEZI
MKAGHRALKQIKSKIWVNLLGGEDGLIESVNSFETWGGDAVDCESSDKLENYKDLNEYLLARYVSGGVGFWNKIMFYTMDIKLSDQETELIKPLLQLAGNITLLINDYFSVEKEWLAHRGNLKSGLPVSSIYFIMDREDVAISEAKEAVKQKLIKTQYEFVEKCEEIFEVNSSHEIKKAVAGYQHLISGVAVWTKFNNRYRIDPSTPFYPQPGHTKADLYRMVNKNCLETERPNEITNGGKSGLKRKNSVPRGEHGNDDDSVKRQKVTSQEQLDIAPWLAKFPQLKEEIVLEPTQYISSIPGKRVRKATIDALDYWYRVPQSSLDAIQSAIDLLHTSSLIIDDIEDGSPIRRGIPAAHMVFGVPQAINSANHLFGKSASEILKLSPAAIKIWAEELHHIHMGQGLDLFHTFHGKLPTEREYFEMSDGKTGGLFRMLCRLMQTEATQNRNLNAEHLFVLITRHYQLRDDYFNLYSTAYNLQKGSLSDLDEGKFSFILIHAMNQSKGQKLQSLLQQRARQGSLLAEQKNLVMTIMDQTKSGEYTLQVIKQLEEEIERHLAKLEESAGGEKNWIIRAIMARMKVSEAAVRSSKA